jgi:hypothetical protein
VKISTPSFGIDSTLPLREGRIAKQFGEGSSLRAANPSPKNRSRRSDFSTLPQGEGEDQLDQFPQGEGQDQLDLVTQGKCEDQLDLFDWKAA